MTTIYEPKGRAGEYAELSLNLWLTCSHGCRYCYCPGMLHKSREEFHQVAPPREGVLEALREKAPQYSGDPRRVLLCFMCDPYQPHEDGLTREALEILVENNVRFAVLTKGGMRAVRDFDLYADGMGTFGTSLSFSWASNSRMWEPWAAGVADRVDAIIRAHEMGIATWLSIEPVIDPLEACMLVEHQEHHIDEFRVGKLNHHPHAATVDWQAFALEVRETLERTGKRYLIKKDLAAYLPEEAGREAKA